MSARFTGQTVIITGASRGLGRAIAAAFGAEGAYVVVGYRALHAAPRRALACPLIANRDGRVAAPDTIPDLLAEQLTRPVCWTRTLETLSALGISDHVTAGPGTVLRGLSRKCLGESPRVHGTEDAAARRRTLAALRGSPHLD